jgi:hypothetical protein
MVAGNKIDVATKKSGLSLRRLSTIIKTHELQTYFLPDAGLLKHFPNG